MTERRRYRPRPDRPVIAVQVRLDIPGFTYHKWGAEQYCKRDDWLVDNDGEVYTVDADSFRRTYRQTAPGTFVKVTPVWAMVAQESGSVATKEGRSHYQKGDYLVSNYENGSDGYVMTAEKFFRQYEADE